MKTIKHIIKYLILSFMLVNTQIVLEMAYKLNNFQANLVLFILVLLLFSTRGDKDGKTN